MYSAWQPSILHPISHPPFSQLFINPFLQKKHSPQNVIQFAATLSPFFKFMIPFPTSTISPTNSCPMHYM